MNKLLRIFFASLGALGIVATGLTPISAFAAEKVTKETVKEVKREKTVKVAKIDINHASEQELEALPGIGAVYAKKIIENRPFRKRADLVKLGIPQKTVDNLKGQIKFGKVEKHHKKKTSKKKDRRSKSEESEVDTKIEKEKRVSRRNETTTEPKPETEKRPAAKRAESNRAEPNPDARAQVRTERVKAPRKGMVWVNTNSMVYHREGDQWYGNTEKGEYMTEDDAIKFGARLSKHD